MSWKTVDSQLHQYMTGLDRTGLNWYGSRLYTAMNWLHTVRSDFYVFLREVVSCSSGLNQKWKKIRLDRTGLLNTSTGPH